jgi:hypothetical protein
MNSCASVRVRYFSSAPAPWRDRLPSALSAATKPKAHLWTLDRRQPRARSFSRLCPPADFSRRNCPHVVASRRLGVNLHDNDLVPIDATPDERDAIVCDFKQAGKQAGLIVPMATVCFLTSGFSRWRVHFGPPRSPRRLSVSQFAQSNAAAQLPFFLLHDATSLLTKTSIRFPVLPAWMCPPETAESGSRPTVP